MPNLNVLTDEQMAILLSVIEAERKRHGNTLNRPKVDWDETFAPETYIARTPTAGIPGLSAGADVTTGTTGIQDDKPGFADCKIYRIVPSQATAGTYDLIAVVDSYRRVFNLNGCAVPGDKWILVTRDKFGMWMFVAAAGDCPVLTLTQQTCEGTTLVTTTYVITLPPGTTISTTTG